MVSQAPQVMSGDQGLKQVLPSDNESLNSLPRLSVSPAPSQTLKMPTKTIPLRSDDKFSNSGALLILYAISALDYAMLLSDRVYHFAIVLSHWRREGVMPWADFTICLLMLLCTPIIMACLLIGVFRRVNLAQRIVITVAAIALSGSIISWFVLVYRATGHLSFWDLPSAIMPLLLAASQWTVNK